MTLTHDHAITRTRRTHRRTAPLDRVLDLHRLDAPTPDDVREQLSDPEPEVRAAAVRALGRAARHGVAARDTGDTIAWALADEDAGIRRLAAGYLRDLPELYLGEDGVSALLLAARRGRDRATRESAAALLAALTSGAAELYAQGLQDDEPQVRVQAVLGLIALRAGPEVAQAADDPSREVRVAVAEGLARFGTAAGHDALAHLVTDHDPVVRMAALDAAADLAVPAGLAARVARAVDDPSWQVRRRAALALATADPETAVPPLLRALRDAIVDVRRTTVQSLEQWVDRPEVLTALTELLTDPDPGVRTQARWALA
ncbi:HEAT repeat domain-containing protein [Actinomadura flavalba]|uniref:HEAT repeat domain-containing protein n=1 Tax=Actinomadura flavalba TaxID=1120938 RepID=UPI000375FE85|nr:HEAT repeat domain-containing protein [Actinomadura flavalba]